MDRAEFLRRVGAVIAAAQLLDGEALATATTDFNPPTEIYRGGSKVTSGSLDQILREYYLPQVKEMLNDPGKFADQSVWHGRTVSIPLHFAEEPRWGEARIHHLEVA